MNIIIKYDKYNTGTLFNRFLGLGVDEEGQFYGIDYVIAEQKYRFILLNNLSEPTKMPDGTLEYRAVLRQSYFIQGYTAEDDISQYAPVYLAKSKASAVYYLGFLDSTLELIMPSTLTINVGMANEWKRLPDLALWQGSQKLDSLIYFDSDDTPHASYFIRNPVSENIERHDAVGDSTPSYTTLIQWSDVLLRYGSYSNITCELKATGTNEYYLFMNLLNVVYADDYSIQTLDIYKIDRSKKDSLVFYITSNTSSNMDGNKLFSALPLDNSITLGYSKAKEIYIILNGLINHKLDRFISICNFFELICQK
jgi:hypothetical protein